ncbi:MAG: TIGR02234 family membrane protein [Mycobacteriaceae bacterium]
MPEQHKHSLRLAVLALVLAAGALWAASRVTWVRVRTVDDLRGVRVSGLSGETWSAELAPLALVVLAAVAATLALRGVALRVLSVVLLAVGVAAAVPGLQMVAGGVSNERAAELATPPAVAEHVSTSTSAGGLVLALVGAVLTLLAAGLLLRSPRTARGLSSRYQSPAALREQAEAGATGHAAPAVDEDVSERLLWDALDAGRDPTDDAESAGHGTAHHPPGEADHPADTVSDVLPGEASEGSEAQNERS